MLPGSVRDIYVLSYVPGGPNDLYIIPNTPLVQYERPSSTLSP